MVADRIRLVRAPNPSPMTLEGTNSYVVRMGPDHVVAIDPGPADDAHLGAIVHAAHALGAPLTHILVTHGHPDHYPGAAPLARTTGARVVAHANARFPHDATLGDGEPLAVAGDATIAAYDTQGHSRDSLTFALTADGETALFTGDLVIGRGTVVVAPPNGDMRVYQASLRRMRAQFPHAAAIYGGHGPRIDDVPAKLDEYLAHREMRERNVLDALRAEPQTIPALVAAIYANVDPILWPAAARQVLAYLLALENEGIVVRSRVARPATADERAILDPDLSKLADPEIVALARAELGYDDAGEPLELFALG
jgi:glyoxylase-like metal-dependent hydrolase (beta-lactamase superfamily II)